MKRFITECRKSDGRYCGYVDALDFEHAQMICDERGNGESVQGLLYAVVVDEGQFSDEQADAMCSAFADAGDDEAPDASEFGDLMDSFSESEA